MSAGGGADEEENVLGGMPQETQSFISLHFLLRQDSACRDDGYPENVFQLPCNKVATNLLIDVRIRQE